MKNKIILGTAQLGLDYGINNNCGKINQTDSLELLHYSYNNGIRFLDTAEVYGNAHDLIGLFHKGFPDKKFNIITKIPHNFKGSLFENVNKYRSQLFVDKIDTLMFHSFETFIKDFDRNKDEVNDLKNNKLIDKIGVSIYTNEELKKVIDTEWIDVIQLPFNLFDNQSKKGDLLELAKTKKKIIHARSVFLQGLFFMERENKSKFFNNFKPYIDEIDRISEFYNISISKLALSYNLGYKNIDNVLIGVDNIYQLQNNLNEVDSLLSDEIISKIDSINVKNEKLLNPTLWKKLL